MQGGNTGGTPMPLQPSLRGGQGDCTATRVGKPRYYHLAGELPSRLNVNRLSDVLHHRVGSVGVPATHAMAFADEHQMEMILFEHRRERTLAGTERRRHVRHLARGDLLARIEVGPSCLAGQEDLPARRARLGYRVHQQRGARRSKLIVSEFPNQPHYDQRTSDGL